MLDMLDRIIAELKTGKKLVLIHFNADPDAMGCAIALQLSFPDVTIGAHNDVNPVAKALRDELNANVVINPNPEEYDKVIVVDTSTPSQLKELANKIQNPILIDHHAKNSLWKEHFNIPHSQWLYYCDDKKSSCAEIVYELLKNDNKKIDEKIGLALLAGIISDTGKFRYAKPETLATFSMIMRESGVEMESVFSLIELDPNKDVPRKIAHLKAAQRLEYEKINGLIIVWTTVGSFEGSVAGVLLGLGADVALVASQVGEEARLSAKASRRAIKHDIHLGRLLEEVGIETKCSGGGHAAAAGLNGPGDAQHILNVAHQKIKTILNR